MHYYVHMIKRTTVELDQELLERAKRVLGEPTVRATIEHALRRVTELAEATHEERAAKQREYFETLAARADLDVLRSEEMWR